MTESGDRTEHDSMGAVSVPADALWGAQTQRALGNFPESGHRMPRPFIRALGLIKAACARSNAALGLIEEDMAEAVAAAALEVAEGRHDAHFPVDVFQTGSGTSTNMNANEVIARLASARLGRTVHPNDHVNRGQSSNDVIPASIHLSAALEVAGRLLPSLSRFAEAIEVRAGELAGVVKTGRTHLMDAMPVTLGQELGGWARQIRYGIARIESVRPRLHELALGGTAVGTGINAHPELAPRAARFLSGMTGLDLVPKPDFFEALSAQDTAVELSGQVRVVAVSIMKIANDLRLMNSGPLAGFGEIALPALQPGSSIMPGKVNPVVPEAAAMMAAQIIGNDVTVTVAGQSGSFQLNVMLPVIAHNLLESIRLAANAADALAERAITGFSVNEGRLREAVDRNPILVTALNAVIGYEKGAAIAKRAYAEGRPVTEVAMEETGLPEDELRRLLDPAGLT